MYPDCSASDSVWFQRDIHAFKWAENEQIRKLGETSKGSFQRVRGAYRAHERRHPGVIFHAFGAFHLDATGDIDSERTHASDRVMDVLRVQATT